MFSSARMSGRLVLATNGSLKDIWCYGIIAQMEWGRYMKKKLWNEDFILLCAGQLSSRKKPDIAI